MSPKTKEQEDGHKSLLEELPLDRLKDEAKNALGAFSSRAASAAGERITDVTGRLTDYAEGAGNGSTTGKAVAEGVKAKASGESPVKGALKGGLSGLKDKVKGALGGGGGGGSSKETKVTNIVESIDVGVPVSVAYNAWSEFQEWSGFMKKLEHAERQKDDEAKVDFKAQVFWSHRRWEAQVIEEVPDERIVWRSKGEKGHVDGAVTFHELGPNLTRILVVLEYHPQGFMEKTGNIWRAQGRRARLELKHFRRHVMTRTILHPDDVEGWRGEIRDGEVVESHEEALEREQEEREDQDRQDEARGDDAYEDEAAYDDGSSEGEGPYEDAEDYENEGYEGDEEEPEAAEDEYDEEPEAAEDEYEEE
ncbi:MAG TPA: SRPBCC family protein, partial [Glycomyces sp.]|nr:SRPBCC family protein [Glycomyces sp.]